MKQTILKRVINSATLASFLFLFLIACGSEDAKFVVSSKKRIVVNPPLAGINIGTTLQYTASLIDEKGEVSDVTGQVTWSSTASAVATVDSSGLAFGVATGTAGIVAALDRLKDSAVLEVTGKTVGSVTILPGEAFTLIGLEKQFAAVAQFTDGTQQDITGVAMWSSSDTAVASVSAGTALGVGVGQATLTASFSGQQSTALLLVSSATPVALVIDPEFTSMPAGTTEQLFCRLLLDNGNSVDVTEQCSWSSEDDRIVTADNSSGSKGDITAVSPGTSGVLAGITFNNQTIAAPALVTVTGAQLVGLEIYPNELTLHRGATANFTAIARFSDNSWQNVTQEAYWFSHDEHVLSIISTGDDAGKALATGVGETVVTVAWKGQSATAVAVVRDAVISSLQIIPASISVPEGTRGTYTAIAFYSDNTHEDVTREATWNSSEPNVVWVVTNGTGAGDAVAVAQGTAVVTASFNGFSDESSAEVTAATITALEVMPESASIPKGGTHQFTATARYSDGTSQDVTDLATWISSDSNIADISNQQGREGLATANNPGSVTIQADFYGMNAGATLNVTVAVIEDLIITPHTVSLPVGTLERFHAEAYFTDGSVYDVTRNATWSSSDSDIAQIATTGVLAGTVLAHSVGQVSIQGSFRGLTANAEAEVTSAVIASLQVTPENISAPAGTRGRYRAVAYYSDRTHEDVTALATWHSSEPDVIKIINSGPAAGTAIAAASGTSSIRADYSGHNDSVSTTITGAVLESIVITPRKETVPAGHSVQYTATGLYSDHSSHDLTQLATWSSSNISVAGIYSGGDNSGTALSYSPGTAIITAGFDGKSTSALLTVAAAVLEDLQITPVDVSIPAGHHQQYTATAFYSDGEAEDVTGETSWGSTDETIAVITSIGENAGVAEALAEGTTGITATYQSLSGIVPLNVTAIVIEDIVILPVNTSVALGEKIRFEAYAVYSDDSSYKVTGTGTWISSNTDVAIISTTGNDAGTAQTLAQGSTDIFFSYNGITESTVLTVTPAVITALEIIPAVISLIENQTVHYTAQATYSDGTGQDVTRDSLWVSSDVTVAYIQSTGESAGQAVAFSAGVAVITAYFGGVSETATITVEAETLDELVILPVNESVPAGTSLQYRSFAVYNSGESIEVTRQADWRSLNTDIAVVENSFLKAGFVTTIAAGSTNIQVTWEGLISGAPLTVTGAELVSIRVEPPDAEIPVGHEFRYTAIGTYTDGSTEDMTERTIWRSSDPEIVFIDSSGESRAWATAIAEGTTTISADHNGLSGSTSVTVYRVDVGGKPDRVEIAPLSPSLDVHKTLQFRLYGYWTLSDGSEHRQELTFKPQTVWKSSNNKIASINNNTDKGLAAGLEAGTTVIEGSYLSIRASTDLTVTAVP